MHHLAVGLSLQVIPDHINYSTLAFPLVCMFVSYAALPNNQIKKW